MSFRYDRFHQNPTNLVIHIVAVPIFVLCFVAALWLAFSGSIVAAMLLFLGVALSLGAQGYGHRLEKIPPEPFTGPADFFARILSEQFYRFWTFVFSGNWYRTVKSSRRPAAPDKALRPSMLHRQPTIDD